MSYLKADFTSVLLPQVNFLKIPQLWMAARSAACLSDVEKTPCAWITYLQILRDNKDTSLLRPGELMSSLGLVKGTWMAQGQI